MAKLQPLPPDPYMAPFETEGSWEGLLSVRGPGLPSMGQMPRQMDDESSAEYKRRIGDWMLGSITDPEMMETGLGFVGGGIRNVGKGLAGLLSKGKVPATAKVSSPTPKADVPTKTLYHGGHRFDEVTRGGQHYPLGYFDLSKSGTGQGAAIHGKGAYLAEARKTGKTYQSIGAKPYTTKNPQKQYDLRYSSRRRLPQQNFTRDILKNNDFNFTSAIRDTEQKIAYATKKLEKRGAVAAERDLHRSIYPIIAPKGRYFNLPFQPSNLSAGYTETEFIKRFGSNYLTRLRNTLKDLKKLEKNPSFLYDELGTLHEFRIPKSELKNIINLDKPMISQSHMTPELQERLSRLANKYKSGRYYPEDMSGQSWYSGVRGELGEDAASKMLLDEGFSGVKFLDQYSRPISGSFGRSWYEHPLRKPTYNYVIPDQELLLRNPPHARHLQKEGGLVDAKPFKKGGMIRNPYPYEPKAI